MLGIGKSRNVIASQPTMVSFAAKVHRVARIDEHGRYIPAHDEDLGVIAYHHKNPLKRLAWRISRLLRGVRPGQVLFDGNKP